MARFRCICMNTRTFNEWAISFGDTISGILAVTGVFWQTAPAGIVEEYKYFKQTYDNKYKEMMGSLQQALIPHLKNAFLF